MLPETIKTAKVTVFESGAGSEDHARIPISPGAKEIAVVLAAQFTVVSSAAAFFFRLGIYKKPDRDLSGDLAAGYPNVDPDENWIYYNPDHQTDATAGNRSTVWTFHWPYPMVLIRSPQYACYAVNDTGSWRSTCMIWYLIQKVTAEELEKLMVKDHA